MFSPGFKTFYVARKAVERQPVFRDYSCIEEHPSVCSYALEHWAKLSWDNFGTFELPLFVKFNLANKLNCGICVRGPYYITVYFMGQVKSL